MIRMGQWWVGPHLEWDCLYRAIFGNQMSCLTLQIDKGYPWTSLIFVFTKQQHGMDLLSLSFTRTCLFTWHIGLFVTQVCWSCQDLTLETQVTNKSAL